MSWTGLALGFALGALGATAHLVAVAWRVALVVRGRPVAALAAYPLGFAAPAAAVLAAAAFEPRAAWSVPAGIVVARALLLRRMGGRP